jgi:hypothetical protein
LLLYAIERVKTQVIFDRDPYESRREALPESRLLKVLVFYQMLKDLTQRGLVRIVKESQDAQAALGGHLARNTLANALCQRDLEQMIEAWVCDCYGAQLKAPAETFNSVWRINCAICSVCLTPIHRRDGRARCKSCFGRPSIYAIVSMTNEAG